jgi:hypothetical protein
VQSTETVRSLAKQLIYVVVVHAFSLLFSSLAREGIDLSYSISLYYPLLLPLIVAPIAVAFFLPSRFGRQAAIALIGILPAEAVFLIFDHFGTSQRSIHIGSSSLWRIVHEGTFGITLMLDAIGFWLAVKMLLEIHRQIDNSQTISSQRNE